MIDDMRVMRSLARELDAARVRTIRDHADDFRVEHAALNCIVDRGEVRSATGEKNREADHSIQLAKPDGGAS